MMKAKYINKSTAKAVLTLYAVKDPDNFQTWARALCLIDDLPAVEGIPSIEDSQGNKEERETHTRIYAHWIRIFQTDTNGKPTLHWTCSHCFDGSTGGYYGLADYPTEYCPNCGAWMVEEITNRAPSFRKYYHGY